MKFSIRDLLLVTVIVALVLGWWLDRSYQAAAAKDNAAAAEQWRQVAEEAEQRHETILRSLGFQH